MDSNHEDATLAADAMVHCLIRAGAHGASDGVVGDDDDVIPGHRHIHFKDVDALFDGVSESG